jgi:pimeloyl-ACP methyl ester carboxylesterase
MPPLTGVGNNQAAVNLGNVHQNQAQQPQGPVQFRSGNKSILTRIAEKLGRATPVAGHGATHAAFTVKTPSQRGASTFGEGQTMGSLGARTAAPNRTDDQGNAIPDLADHQRNITDGLRQSFVGNVRVDSTPRLNLNYTVTNSSNETLSGYSISADPNSANLDLTRPVVVYFSGSGGTAEEYGADIGKAYALNKNANFVAVNYRGYGASDQTGLSEKSLVKDGMSIINHLVQQGFDPNQIIVHGYSMGADVASHVQARVEESGHQLRGVIYDRPMTSATGAAHDYGREMVDNPVGKAIVGQIGKAVAKLTVGSMSAHKTLNALKNASPSQQLRSPTLFTKDTGAFGDRSARMATDLGSIAIDLQADHFTQTAFVTRAMPMMPNSMFA